MDEETEIDLVKSAIGQRKQNFVMKAGGPNEPVRTGVFDGIDIRRSHCEIRFRFHPIEKMTEAQNHTIIVNIGDPTQRMRIGEWLIAKDPQQTPHRFHPNPRFNLNLMSAPYFPKLPCNGFISSPMEGERRTFPHPYKRLD
jgi:hypothetical protein